MNDQRERTRETTEIEVEVVDIENSAPTAGAEVAPSAAESGQWHEWQRWRGEVRRFDSRWWPLWVIPGIIVFLLLATVGVAIGLLVAFFLLCRRLLRALFQ